MPHCCSCNSDECSPNVEMMFCDQCNPIGEDSWLDAAYESRYDVEG